MRNEPTLLDSFLGQGSTVESRAAERETAKAETEAGRAYKRDADFADTLAEARHVVEVCDLARSASYLVAQAIRHVWF